MLGGFVRADDGVCNCQCCGITGDLIGAVTNAALANCSSNCVRLTPETCAQVKEGMTNLLERIITSTSGSVAKLVEIEDSLQHLSQDVYSIGTSLEWVKVALNNNVDLESSLSQVRDRVSAFSNYWSEVDTQFGALIVTNILTHSALQISTREQNRPLNFVRSINLLLSSLASNIVTNQENISIVLNDIDSVINDAYNLSATIDFLYLDVADVRVNLSSIQNEATPLQSMMESFDCEPCGKGGGSSSSSGSSVDLTPVIAAIQSLNEDMGYWFQRLYDLLTKYYRDYEVAASQGITGKATLSGYQALPNNWFKRIEYLLYSVADLQEADTSDVPQTPDGNDDLSDFESSSSSSAERQDTDLRNRATSSLNRIKSSVDNFLTRFQQLGFVNQNIDGSIVMEFPSTLDDSGTTHLLQIPQGFTATFSVLRKAFKVVWYAALAVLYFYFIKFAFFCIVSYLRWFLTICSATFGSN